MRKIIALKDEFHNRYIIKDNLFTPVFDAFVRNNGRYNLLDSVILEMFEFIKLVSIRITENTTKLDIPIYIYLHLHYLSYLHFATMF